MEWLMTFLNISQKKEHQFCAALAQVHERLYSSIRRNR